MNFNSIRAIIDGEYKGSEINQDKFNSIEQAVESFLNEFASNKRDFLFNDLYSYLSSNHISFTREWVRRLVHKLSSKYNLVIESRNGKKTIIRNNTQIKANIDNTDNNIRPSENIILSNFLKICDVLMSDIKEYSIARNILSEYINTYTR